MNIFKKIISSVCAITILSSLTVMSIANAATPKLSLRSENGEYSNVIIVSVSDLDDYIEENDRFTLFEGSLVFKAADIYGEYVTKDYITLLDGSKYNKVSVGPPPTFTQTTTREDGMSITANTITDDQNGTVTLKITLSGGTDSNVIASEMNNKDLFQVEVFHKTKDASPVVLNVNGFSLTPKTAAGMGNAKNLAGEEYKVFEKTNTASCTMGESSDVAVTGVTLDQSAVELDLNGTKTATLTATVTPDNATDPSVTWTSSVPGVATVDGGVVTAVATGTTVITATAGDFSATCTVTVVDTTPATSGKGTVTTEDATDAAEWAWDTVTGAGNAVEVTVDADGTTYKKTFTLGALVENAGATKIGVILQYNPTVFTSGISITGINLVNAN